MFGLIYCTCRQQFLFSSNLWLNRDDYLVSMIEVFGKTRFCVSGESLSGDQVVT